MKKKENIQKIFKNKIPVWGYSPKGVTDPSLSIQLCQAGGIGLIDLEGLNQDQCQNQIDKLFSSLTSDHLWGIRISNHNLLNTLNFRDVIPIIVCAFSPNKDDIQSMQKNSKLLLSEVSYLEEAYETAEWSDLFLVKGHEAGGIVGTKNSFILIQEFQKAGLSFIIQGGFGVYNVCSAFIGGAIGVVLESQLYLLPECPLSPDFKNYIKTIDENDFYIVQETSRYNYRLIGKLANKSIRTIKSFEQKNYSNVNNDFDTNYLTRKDDFHQVIKKFIDKFPLYSDSDPKHSFLPSDHGICFANFILTKFQNLENFLTNIINIITNQIKNCINNWPFTKNSEFATKLGIKYPIIQGPMANISDNLSFARKISNNGALPILALGGLLPDETSELLSNCNAEKLSENPYGCGIIGLDAVKPRRDEHLRCISKFGPEIILIAAGTIDLGVQVKNSGNIVLIHTPALSMFKEALKRNLNYMILEGNECGGHVGTLSSFTLWEHVLEYMDIERKNFIQKVNIIFAGGIINGVSSAMLAGMISNHLDIITPGIQMGTAYLLSEEIVTTKALSPVYQELLLNNTFTNVIGVTVNTRARVIPSEFSLYTIKNEYLRKSNGISLSQRKKLYEEDNLGALRIASRAEIWNENHEKVSGTSQFIPISTEEQLTKGVFMTGDSISLQKTIRSIPQIHSDIIEEGLKFIRKNSNYILKETLGRVPMNKEKYLKKIQSIGNKIAIVGMGGLFPDAENIPQFWDNIISKKYSITTVPKDRWDSDIFYDSDHSIPDKTYTKIGGFVKKFEFKSIKYRIPPKMADRMDLVQKWAIITAEEALIDAGYPIDGKKRLSIATIVGNSSGGDTQRISNKRILFNEIKYRLNEASSQMILKPEEKENLLKFLESKIINHIPVINEDTMPGELANIIAGRVANVFNLTGKSMTTDAACASSLAAIDTAVNGLLVKDYDTVLVGGVDSSMDPQTYIKFCKIGALSEDGTYPFDSRANGFVMGEGAGFIVLKRLEDALHDKNKIYAIISGFGGSSDGKGKGITAPNPEGQRLAIERTLENTNLSPSDIQYLECHGTSTIVGDATELSVLSQIFSDRNVNQKLALGSIKSQIGHLKSAAGIASIIKTVLALYNKIIPPSINVSNLNPTINWENAPYYVNTEPTKWSTPENGIRRAGVSSFGFGGTNYHVILEEFLPHLYTNVLTERAEDFPLCEELMYKQFESHQDNSIIPSSTDLCFLFSGQGSQYVGMTRELYEKYQVVKNTLNKANDICKEFGSFNLLKIIFGDNNLSQEENSDKLKQTEFTQPAIYSVEMALVNLFKSKGITPGIVGGHSLGEFAALVTAGVLSFEDGLKTVIRRGISMSELPPGVQCTMAAIFTSPDIVEKTLNELSNEDVSISNYNSTSQTVISGEISAVESIMDAFSKKEIRAIRLNVSNAFHSKYVAHAEEKLKDFLKTIEFKSPQIPVFSNVTGKVYPNDPDKIKSILLKQITSPVRWVDEVLNMYQKGGRKFLELGPKKALFFFTKDILKKYKDIEVNFTLSPKSSEKDHIQKVFDRFSALESISQKERVEIEYPSIKDKKIKISRQAESSIIKRDTLRSNEYLSKIVQLPSFKDFLEEQKVSLSSALMEGFYKYLEKNSTSIDNQFNKGDIDSTPIVITGVGIGLPGKNRKVFDDKNVDDILDGINLIDLVSTESQNQLLQKKIIRLEKSPNGNAKFVSVDDISNVIHLAGQLGEFNPNEDYHLNPKLLNALDITFQMAICAGYDALKDSGIPLVRSTIKTSTGKTLSGDWILPESLQDDTGIIFASAFPGYDNFVEEFRKYSNFDCDQKKSIEENDKNFNRSFLFRVLSMGHSQFAQLIKAKGPNTSTNAACASTPQAIGIAEDWIRNGRCKRVIVITADNVTSRNLFQWIGAGFIASGAATTKNRWEDAVLPFGEGRNGIILGAGASAFVIEQQMEAEARGVKPIVEILGSYFANSAFHGTRLDKDHISQKLEEFIQKIERTYDITREELAKEGMFVSHETYSPARGGSAESELIALRNTFGNYAQDMVIINTKGYTGHAMGAGIEEAVAIKSLEKGKIPPIANLNRIDPNYSNFNFSAGINERKKYALRFAAGFGSQLAIVLFRLKSFNNRFANPNYQKWLQSIGGDEKLIFIDGRLLKMKTERVPLKKATIFSTETTESSQKVIPSGTSEILNEIKYIISLKTGYDPADIDDTFDLEEDLGIDTVKQAEIFGEIKKKWDIEVDDSFNLADYRTINEIVQMLNDFLRVDLITENDFSCLNEFSLEKELINIISEKTGYDIEDIDIEFDLEEDLGIDTVKQAEIFGALRSNLNIPEDTEINLLGLGSIKNIIQKIQVLMSDKIIDGKLTQNIYTPIEVPDDIKQINNLVKKIIAEKTGYDLNDIDDLYDLEEDLGIDTVKQAEIFGELRNHYKLEDSIEINISEIRTPNDITQFIMQYFNEKSKIVEKDLGTTGSVDKVQEEIKEEKQDSIYVSQVVPSQIFKLETPEIDLKYKSTDTLLLNINLGLSNYGKLIKSFENYGLKIQVLNVNSDENFSSDLNNKKHDSLFNTDFKILLLVTPDNNQYTIDDSLSIFDNLFLIFQSLNLSIIERILVLSPETTFGWEEGANPLSASISAFIKTINREFKIPIKLISSKNLSKISQEFLTWDTVEEVSYVDNFRYTLLRQKIEVLPEQNPLSITEEDVLLVTGGAQGITFACIDELTNYTKPQLILMGLASYENSLNEYLNYTPEMLNEKKLELVNKLKSEHKRVTPVMINKEWKNFLDKLDTLRNIEKLRSKGLKVQYFAGDITDDEFVSTTLQKSYKQNKNPITIVIHGAGIEESKNFLNKKLNVAHKVVDVKVGGFSNILKHIKLQDVKYFIAFCSVAGRYGNQGQIDYAFANSYLSRLAWKFNQDKIPFLIFDWTAWADIGMATQGSTLQILTQAGVRPVPSKTGVKIFTKLVLNNFTGEYVIAGELGIFEEKLRIEEVISKLEYPMLERINYQSARIIGYNTIDSKFDVYLLDHQIQRKPVFPGVMVLETFAEFYHRMFDKPLTSISNVNFLTPLKIPIDKTINIELIFNKSNNEISFQSKTFPTILKGKPLVKERFNAKFNEPTNELKWKKESISEPLISLLEKTEIYELFFHGPKFQVLKEVIQLEKEKIVTMVDLPTAPLINNKEDQFQIKPLILESVFQTAALFDFIINGYLSLPSKISILKILSNQKPKYIVAKFLKRDDEKSYYNSVVLSEDQEIIVIMENLEIIHAPMAKNISPNLSNYLGTLKEYYHLKNNINKHEIHVLPITKIHNLYQTNPKFLDYYLTEQEIDNSKRFRNLKRKIEYFSGIIAAKELYFRNSYKRESYHDIEIQKDDKGKPFYFSNKLNQIIPLNLSISHSNEFSVAINGKNLVGIDLEIIEFRSSSFYKEVFTELERNAISEDNQLGTIYWTAKEAFSKAIGEGFNINFKDFELKYEEKHKKFTISFKNEKSEFNDNLRSLQLGVDYTKKYVLSYCELKPFKEIPTIQ
ncbi:MAG: beta-ketoacyl synthase N-terminal-like domain-containing protein [Promethearchaeota archaeon]